MDNLKYIITTNLYQNGIIEQIIDYESYDIQNIIMRNILNIKEDQIKEALIKLGWTPPNEKINNY